ncbi:MAG: type II toxin-antitoxin system HicB family antitoxin [Anaerolineales bacterium]
MTATYPLTHSLYNAYLALAPKGVHAHVIALPGCFTRGATQEEALAALPGAIRAYLADLQRHGDPSTVLV